MIQAQTCNRCGLMLSEALADGLCTRCMVRDALETIDEALPTDRPRIRDELVVDPLSRPASGRSFGEYELLEEIARGGMGVVYKARQKSLNRCVAIKLISIGDRADPLLMDRLTGEAQAAAVLQHPNIVSVHEVGEFGDQRYLTMDYVEGSNLHELCAQEPLNPRRAARYVKTIAAAIDYAHRQGVLHRDLKPSNVLIDQFDQPRITDFGLAKSLATDAHLTLSGQTLGTPQYMPPEQVSIHHGTAGPWGDVYSIGGILYHLLTGRPPFVGSQVGDVLQQVLSAEPVAPRLLNPGVPRDLETICLQCLEKEPARRYATAGDLAEELARFLDNKPILSRPVSVPERAWRWCRRRPLIAGLWLALAVAVLVGTAGVLSQWQRARVGELAARRNAYAGDMILVQQSLAEGDLGQARSLLDRERPPANQPDLRGWEWRYRWQQSQPDAALQRSLYQHASAVNGVAVASDGKWLALSADDGTVAAVDLVTGVATVLPLSKLGPAVVAISPDADLLAFSELTGWEADLSQAQAKEQGRLSLWSVTQGQEAFAFTYEGRVISLAFTPNGKFLVAMAIDHTWTNQTVTVWDLESQSLATTRTIAKTPTQSYDEAMAISPQGDVVAVGDAVGRIHVLGLPELESRLDFPAHGEMVTALAFSPDGRTIASGAGFSDSSVRLWDATTGKAIADPLVGHQRFVHALKFSPDGQTLASASADQSVRLWNVSTAESVATIRGHGQEVCAVDYFPDGSGLVSACKDGAVWLWDISAVTTRSAALTADGVWQFAFLADGRSGAVVTTDGTVELWDLSPLRRRESLPDLGNNNWMSAPSTDGRLLAVADHAGRVKVWDLNRPRVIRTLRAAKDHSTTWAKFAANNGQLFTAGLNPECRVTRWDTTTWQPTGSWRLGATPYTGDVALSGRYVISGLTDGALVVLDCAANRQSLLADGAGAVTAAAMSPDESILATGNDQCMFRLWNARTWHPLSAPLRGHRLGIPSIAFSPDGQRIATAGSSGEEAVILWDVATRRTVATLTGEGSRFIWVSFSPDGNTIAAVTRDSGKLHLWCAPSFTEIEAQGIH